MKKIIIPLLIFFSLFSFAQAEEIEINFFFSPTCPHCAAEKVFLDELESKYPEAKVARFDVTDPDNITFLKQLYEEYSVPKEQWGLVPATFTPDEYFVGFNDHIAGQIENCTQHCISGTPNNQDNLISLPIIGPIDPTSYSLPALAVVLGFFDGFNVCSLGALVLILGLVVALRDRKKILIFGSIFILTTALVYGLLIVLWYQIFAFFAPHLRMMEMLVGLLGIGGGLYFLKEFLRLRKEGVTCNTNKGVVAKLSTKLEESLKNQKSIIILLCSILVFAAIITLLEFPCSAAVPMFFAGVLSQAGLSSFHYLILIAVFVLFYMLDEIVVFLIAFATMSIKLASPKFTTWIVLVEAIVLLALGTYYIL